MKLTLTTELDAVNAMLAIIAEAPVNTLEDSGLIDAAMARQLLRNTSREVQTRGWTWNTDLAFFLAADAEGTVPVPANALSVDPADPTVDAVVRGSRLWDRVNHTFAFLNGGLKCDVVRFLPFEELPEAARYYITVRAGRIFADRNIGSKERSGFTERDEIMALVALQNEEARGGDYSLYNVSPVRNLFPRRSGAGWKLL